MPKPFAWSADLAKKEATLERLADGVHAYHVQGDPNVGAIHGTDATLAMERARSRDHRMTECAGTSAD